MSRARRVPLTVASMAAVAILMSACGSSSGGGNASGTDNSSEQKAGDGSPLDNLFGFDSDSQRLVEDATAKCMRDRGWEYTPRPPIDANAFVDASRDGDFVAQYGYGISTEPPLNGQVVSTGVGGDDPNGAYQKTLSEADQARYMKDLYGDLGTADQGSSGVVIATPELDPNACSSIAQQEAAKKNPALSDAFNRRFGELMQRLDNDPRMVEAMKKWSACMADAGFVYDTQQAIFEDLGQRYQEIRGGQAGAGIGSASIGGVAETTVPLSPADAQRLSKLQDEERAIAKADGGCSKKELDGTRKTLELEIYDTLKGEFPGLGAGS